VTALRPSDPAPLVLSVGTWTDGTLTYFATVRIDPRLFAWLVNGAQRRASKTYKINEGQPPVLVTLTPD
jgi:hypothetical protein